jgi:perosamine synthetase
MAIGLKAGDKTILPSYSFVATANSTRHCGGEPVFVDIASDHYNIDPSRIEHAIDSKARALVVVHQFGFAADMDPIMAIAKRSGLAVIEDAACSLGSAYRGRMTGGFGDVACISFHPRKIITTGEGGMLLTDSDVMADRARSLRNHGMAPSPESGEGRCFEAGYNFRMTDVQAAIGLAQLEKLDDIIRLRTERAERYNAALSKHPALRLPKWPGDAVANYQSFALDLIDESIDREVLLAFMAERGIRCGSGIRPIHQEPAYERQYAALDLPETIRAGKRSFLLPLYPGMTKEEQGLVIDTLRKALDRCTARKETG